MSSQMKLKIARGIVEIKDVKEFLEKLKVDDCIAVFVDSNYVLQEDVLEFAVKKALNAWNEGRRVAKTLQMEILLYIAATRQIDKAKKIGLKEGKNEIYLIVLGKNENCYEKIKLLSGFKEIKHNHGDLNQKIRNIIELYDINDNELEIVGLKKLPLLIRERIVLFDLFK